VGPLPQSLRVELGWLCLRCDRPITPLLQAVRECLIGVDNPKINTTSEENTAAGVLTALFAAEKTGQGIEKTVQDIVGDYGWTENIAVNVLSELANAL
jgi:hypothetical protein